ncbi:dipeptide/oligopeptide/nickel ABC transporter permease/ATP-binding protein [Actinomadura madurae]|uniref:dipeptide/oligopeptide/nickel ABC transporter permease/ATP-binding protein n=1 Tax=Actinomadura madurae TaxID=1993 RepID=UPI00202658BF|nr:dipeptide/oligopeptide/nickel ABC transporter permease/ATP-binding protein [Actinomadura madurae]MCQ0011011.1 dipeptide/oligopeptide/nickel ABC transporter permease/ATP-binding protein [Actinomadura madurae]URM93889.1 dipeptide/oligopeptide/nickel ABC transporter permease/ATP-binding protein [Actinomadura madurae]
MNTDRRPRGYPHRVLGSPRGMLSLGWLALVVAGSFLAPWLAPHDPLEQDIDRAYALPSGTYWAGTDSLGRDILSRIMHGGSVSLLGAGEALLVAVVIGVPLGMLAGYRGGVVDAVLSRIAEVVMSLPVIVILLAVVAVYGRAFTITMGALGVILSASFIRLARATTEGKRNELYVDAARVSGLGHLRIAVRHILPNITAPLLIQSTLALSSALLIQAGLGFLGLGPEPPAPSWGSGIADAAKYVNRDGWLMVPTGAVLIFTVLAFNSLGDALRDATGHAARSVERRRRITSSGVTRGSGRLLEVDGLRVEYPGRRVIDDVTLHVDAGEVLALVGESGSGKTQTAFSVLGLLAPGGRITGGGIHLDGSDLLALPDRKLAALRGTRMAYIPQEPMSNLDPCFTVGSQMVEPLVANLRIGRAEARKRALALLARVGIGEPERVYRSYPHEISGGMAQRVLIARAVSCEPSLLIADEPTTALDVTVQAEVLDLLRDLQRERRMGIVLVTHDFGVVADIADRVAVMQNGRLVEEGPVDELFASPSHPYTKMLLGSSLEGREPRKELRHV